VAPKAREEKVPARCRRNGAGPPVRRAMRQLIVRSRTRRPPMGWQDKHRQATQLLTEIKAANARGVRDGQEASELHIKLAEAQRLGDEVRSERLDELVRRADLNVSNSGAGLTKNFGNG